MPRQWGDEAVPVYLGRTIWRVTSTEKAAELLLKSWPEACQESRPCLTARKACLAALEGRGTPEQARAAFLKAAKAAGILVTGSWGR